MNGTWIYPVEISRLNENLALTCKTSIRYIAVCSKKTRQTRIEWLNRALTTILKNNLTNQHNTISTLTNQLVTNNA